MCAVQVKWAFTSSNKFLLRDAIHMEFPHNAIQDSVYAYGNIHVMYLYMCTHNIH